MVQSDKEAEELQGKMRMRESFLHLDFEKDSLTHDDFTSLKEFIRMYITQWKKAQDRAENPTSPLIAFEELQRFFGRVHLLGSCDVREQREENLRDFDFA